MSIRDKASDIDKTDPILDSKENIAARKASREFLEQNGVSASAAESTKASNAATDTEIAEKVRELARLRASKEAAEAAKREADARGSRGRTLKEALGRVDDMVTDPAVLDEHISDATSYYDEERLDDEPAWTELTIEHKAQFVRAFLQHEYGRIEGDTLARAQANIASAAGMERKPGAQGRAGRTGEEESASAAADSGDVRTTQEVRSGETGVGQPYGQRKQTAKNVASGVERGASAESGTRQAGSAEPAATGLDSADGNDSREVLADAPKGPVGAGGEPQFSKATATDETHTSESLEDALLSFIEAESLGKRIHIVESAADLRDVRDLVAYKQGDAVAWARNGHAYLVADRIQIGTERGVFMHEVGGHIGLERLLGKAEFSRLAGKITEWAARNDGSQEATFAKAALARAEQAGNANDKAEHVAYFLEEAVNGGIRPTSMQYSGELNRWFRSVWAAFKTALRRLGVNPDKLTAQDVVDMGYGAARIAANGGWHGTTAKVQQFRTKFMGTGEGAQAYGWGLYFSQLRGVGESYRDADVGRKSTLRDQKNRRASRTVLLGGEKLPSDLRWPLEDAGVLDSGSGKLATDWKSKLDSAIAKKQDVVDRRAAEVEQKAVLKRDSEAAEQYELAAEDKHRKAIAALSAAVFGDPNYDVAKKNAASARDAMVEAGNKARVARNAVLDYTHDFKLQLEAARAEPELAELLGVKQKGLSQDAPSTEPVTGKLYATDFNIKDDEWLDWGRPLDEHRGAVRDVLNRPGFRGGLLG